jgi:hypothetical protein
MRIEDQRNLSLAIRETERKTVELMLENQYIRETRSYVKACRHAYIKGEDEFAVVLPNHYILLFAQAVKYILPRYVRVSYDFILAPTKCTVYFS